MLTFFDPNLVRIGARLLFSLQPARALSIRLLCLRSSSLSLESPHALVNITSPDHREGS